MKTTLLNLGSTVQCLLEGKKKKDKVNLIFKQKITSSVLLQINILLCNNEVKGNLTFVKNRK